MLGANSQYNACACRKTRPYLDDERVVIGIYTAIIERRDIDL